MSENQKKPVSAENEAQTDVKLVSAVTAAVVQTLQELEEGKRSKAKKDNENGKGPKTIDLIGLVFYIVEKLWIVLLVAILGAGIFGYTARNSVTTYTATAKLYIVNADSPSISFSDLQLGTVLTLDYQEVFKTWEVHEMVRQELDLPYTYDQMQSFITVTNPEDTRILYITARFPDGQTAADIANAYANAAKKFIINTMRGEEPSDFSVALVPSSGYTVSKSSSIIKGFLLGTVLALGVLTLLYVLDDRPRTPEDISTYGGIPTLAVLPSVKDIKRFNRRHKKRNASRRRG